MTIGSSFCCSKVPGPSVMNRAAAMYSTRLAQLTPKSASDIEKFGN